MAQNDVTNIIKVQFIKDCEASGQEYTYYAPKPVSVGDIVDVETERGTVQAQVSRVNVPQEEIARFGTRVKHINGKTALRCEDCEMLEPSSGDGTATRACMCAESRFPILLNMRVDDYLWCKGCLFRPLGGSRTSGRYGMEKPDGQQELIMPVPVRTPWD